MNVGEGDEIKSGVALDCDESVPLNLAGFKEASIGAREHFIAIAGVGNESNVPSGIAEMSACTTERLRLPVARTPMEPSVVTKPS